MDVLVWAIMKVQWGTSGSECMNHSQQWFPWIPVFLGTCQRFSSVHTHTNTHAHTRVCLILLFQVRDHAFVGLKIYTPMCRQVNPRFCYARCFSHIFYLKIITILISMWCLNCCKITINRIYGKLFNVCCCINNLSVNVKTYLEGRNQ